MSGFTTIPFLDKRRSELIFCAIFIAKYWVLTIDLSIFLLENMLKIKLVEQDVPVEHLALLKYQKLSPYERLSVSLTL